MRTIALSLAYRGGATMSASAAFVREAPSHLASGSRGWAANIRFSGNGLGEMRQSAGRAREIQVGSALKTNSVRTGAIAGAIGIALATSAIAQQAQAPA